MSTSESVRLGQWPKFDDDEIAAATDVLVSGKVNYWTGDQGQRFEAELASRFQTRHALTVTNGTAALELALRALGIGPGDEVIVTPRSYFASTGCVLAVGATPVFADVDTTSQNIEAHTIEPHICERTRAILPVHLAGWPCDMDAMMRLASNHDLLVIEDCAQAHGATWQGRPVGSFGDAAALSFCQDKIITTAGEGGALLTSLDSVFSAAWSLREDGKSRTRVLTSEHVGRFEYLRERVGSNCRMSEVQSAVGRVQLARLDRWLEIRRRWASIYDEQLSGNPALFIARPRAAVGHAYYQYMVQVRPDGLRQGVGRDELLGALLSRGIPCSAGACPEIYREAPVIEAGAAPAAELPNAATIGGRSLALPVHPGLTADQVRWIASQVQEVVDDASA